MTQQFAPPTFISGFEETLAVVDTYAGNVKDTINSATSAFKNIEASVLDTINGSKVIQDAKLFINTYNQLKKLSKRELVDRLGVMIPEVGKLTATYDTLKNTVDTGKQYLAAAQAVRHKVTAEINGVKQIISSTNFESISSISKSVHELSRNKFPILLSDVNTAIDVHTMLLRQAVTLKVPGVFTALSEASTSTVHLAGVVRNVIGDVVTNSDIHTLHEMASNEKTSAVVNEVHPEVINDFATNFKLDPQVPVSEHPALAEKAMEAFDKIKPGWDTATRGETTVTDLTVIVNASNDFKAVVASGGESSDERAKKARVYYDRALATGITAVQAMEYVPSKLRNEIYSFSSGGLDLSMFDPVTGELIPE